MQAERKRSFSFNVVLFLNACIKMCQNLGLFEVRFN